MRTDCGMVRMAHPTQGFRHSNPADFRPFGNIQKELRKDEIVTCEHCI
jgi:hypothetical protein